MGEYFMNYEKPTITIGESDGVQPTACTPGFAFAVAVAAAVWDAVGVVNYAGVVNVSFLFAATGCLPYDN